MSSFFAVLVVWIVYSLILKITSSIIAAFTAALLLAFTPLLWSQAVASEVYTLHTFFVALLIKLLWDWDETRKFSYLILIAFIAGISLCNHLQTLMLAPAVFFIIISGDKESFLDRKKFFIVSLFFMIALLLYLYLPIRTEADAVIHWGDPNNFERFIAHVTGKGHRSFYVLNRSPLEYLLRTKEILRSIWTQFGVILFMAVWGWLKLPSVRWRVFSILVIFFDSVYTVFLNIISLEITAFALPTCIMLVILVGIGIAHTLKTISSLHAVRRLAKKAMETVFCAIPILSLILNYSLCDQSRNYIAYEHAVNIVGTVDSGSTIIMDGDNNIFPIMYGRIVERMREDVTLYDRYNLFFKMPYMGDSKGTLTYFGKWEDLRDILERKIIEKMVDQGIYFAVFNPFSISLSEQYKMVPFGILRQILKKNDVLKQERAVKVWDYYFAESLNTDFERDFMNREVTSFFHFSKGTFYYMIDEPQIGLNFFRLASEIGYNDKNIHSDIALFLMGHGYFNEARLELEKALIYNEDLSGVHNNWGYYYYKLGKLDKAIESFQKAIELNPENHTYYNNLGFIFYETGKIIDARYMFKKSIEINDNQQKIKEFLKD